MLEQKNVYYFGIILVELEYHEYKKSPSLFSDPRSQRAGSYKIGAVIVNV